MPTPRERTPGALPHISLPRRACRIGEVRPVPDRRPEAARRGCGHIGRESGVPSAVGSARGSGGVAESADDVLVEAEVFFGGFHGEPAVELFADAEVELARVGPR